MLDGVTISQNYSLVPKWEVVSGRYSPHDRYIGRLSLISVSGTSDAVWSPSSCHLSTFESFSTLRRQSRSRDLKIRDRELTTYIHLSYFKVSVPRPKARLAPSHILPF